jgi:hypothetical protein
MKVLACGLVAALAFSVAALFGEGLIAVVGIVCGSAAGMLVPVQKKTAP